MGDFTACECMSPFSLKQYNLEDGTTAMFVRRRQLGQWIESEHLNYEKCRPGDWWVTMGRLFSRMASLQKLAPLYGIKTFRGESIHADLIIPSKGRYSLYERSGLRIWGELLLNIVRLALLSRPSAERWAVKEQLWVPSNKIYHHFGNFTTKTLQ